MFSLKIIARLFLFCYLVLLQNITIFSQTVSDSKKDQFIISIDKKSPMEIFGAAKIVNALQKIKITSQLVDKASATGKEQVQVKILNKNEDAKIKFYYLRKLY